MDAYESLSCADERAPLAAGDLEFLATSAYMLSLSDEYQSALERAHYAYLEVGEALRAVRCAFWLGADLALRGEMGPASGWFGRAQRLLEREQRECVERGYLLLPVVLQQVATGAWEAAYAAAVDAARVGERFGDADLLALAVQEQGRALIKQGRVEEGLGLLDEAMVAVTAGELSPIVTGLVYCSVIAFCQEVYALRRAQEWTAALTHWCARQPDMVAFTGRCLVHRAEIMQIQGAWQDALDEAKRACERLEQDMNQLWAGQAFYQQAEVRRLQGEFVAAEEAYREASRCGWEPQPGLALSRLAQGKDEAAAGTIRRAVGEATERLKRARLLPAYVEIMLAVGDAQEARRHAASSRRSRRSARAACWMRWPRRRGAPSTLPKGRPGLPWARCVRHRRSGKSSRRRTRPHACACSSGWPAAPSATTTRQRWSWKRRALYSSSWERRRTSRGSTRCASRPRPAPRMGCPRVSYRCCASSPQARRTKSSPPRSCSASERSIGT
jgi:tetratricopeptide (TPR) repeat protein